MRISLIITGLIALVTLSAKVGCWMVARANQNLEAELHIEAYLELVDKEIQCP